MPTPTIEDSTFPHSESMGSPRSAMETVKLAASRLAEVRRHERASSPDPFKDASDANNDFSGIDEGTPITQIMREDLIRGTEGDQRLKEWLEKYVYGYGSSSPSTSITTAATESI
ncbi:hypothetical protein FOZ63_006976 [Perkinsus olseni]|uniref:Uncharacterized protein n=1 Tax=Perkinsus olseni TaxID=32597 RepID=A0A7J6UHB8_PEROL|nr:hypothetical protein FOZ63_006976 [Perkinsus olseni]